MRKCKPFLALAVLLFALGVGMANTTPPAAKSALPVAKVTDCCDDPACPPGCSKECPPDCGGSPTVVKKTACCDCPPCPFCP
jgi:hypothetical protein